MSEWCPVKTAKGSSKFFLMIFPRSVEAVSLEAMVWEEAPRTQMTHLTQTRHKGIDQASNNFAVDVDNRDNRCFLTGSDATDCVTASQAEGEVWFSTSF